MKNKKKQIIITLIAIISLIVITVGVTYAFFNYAKEGTTDNTIKTGSITFLYTEVSGVGKGISLTEAYPVADSIGKVQVGEGKVFDFKITSNISMDSSIGYQVTARKKTGSTLANSAVKVYLTEVSGTEQELLLSKYSELDQTDRVNESKYTEKVLYEDTVSANTSNYEKNFRLRMWVSDDTDFSDGSMNDKTFTLTVNVYADGKVVNAPENKAYTFDYTGNEQIFEIPASSNYLLEVWGASGGSIANYIGGYGGYSRGIIQLNKGDKLYINVGGKGVGATTHGQSLDGGYNGGGSVIGTTVTHINASGGGATHIATSSGLLSTLEENKTSILIVSGGGGGARDQSNHVNAARWGTGGSGGGMNGVGPNSSFGSTTSFTVVSSLAGTQSSGNAFGMGESVTGNSAGGGGYYGGFSGGDNHSDYAGAGGGGSGYIGNSLLTSKIMYCYNCSESSGESTKTISTTNVSEDAIINYAKIGNGYARITYLSELESALKSIEVSGCDIGQQFYPLTTEYNCVVENDVTNVNISAKLLNNKLKVSGLGNKQLSIGENIFPVSISDEENNKRIYYVKIVREWPKYTFDYTGTEQIFTVPATGKYKLETWGAQGGSVDNYIGGYGGYSTGIIQFNAGEKLYINVGGQGLTSNLSTDGVLSGGYNGGGNAYSYLYASYCSNTTAGSGGGATHVSLTSGLLSTLKDRTDSILIVSSGGGGSLNRNCGTSDYAFSFGGAGGGYIGNSSVVSSTSWPYTLSTGGMQTIGGIGGTINNESGISNGDFGLGGSTTRTGGYTKSSGGGSGFYGGGNGMFTGSGGGSGYIGNSLLTDKVMYCYNCQESSEESTKTISTTNVSEEAISNYAKQGNGYARITYLGN